MIVECIPQYPPHMATIQIVIDEPLLERLDHELKGKGKQRSAFVRAAIDHELRRVEHERLIEEDLLSYKEPDTEQELREAAAEAKLGARAWDDLALGGSAH